MTEEQKVVDYLCVINAQKNSIINDLTKENIELKRRVEVLSERAKLQDDSIDAKDKEIETLNAKIADLLNTEPEQCDCVEKKGRKKYGRK